MGVVAVIDALSFLDSIRFHGHGTVFSMKFEAKVCEKIMSILQLPNFFFFQHTRDRTHCKEASHHVRRDARVEF